MKLSFFLAVISLLTACTSAPPQNDRVIYELSNGDGYDLSALSEHIKDKRIIALGEASHGLGAVYELKSALVEYLHAHEGYEVLAIEAGIGDACLAWSDSTVNDAKALRDMTVFGNFSSLEILPLFKYIAANKSSARPLNYAGFDSQVSSNNFYDTMRSLCGSSDSSLMKEIDAHSQLYYDWYSYAMQGDSIAYEAARKQYIATADKLLALTDSLGMTTPAPFSTLQGKIIRRTLQGFIDATDFPFAWRFMSYARRDSLMFENIRFLAEEIYPEKKIILWAHNAHLEESGIPAHGGVPMMGHYLAQTFGDDYYSIGIFALGGEVYQHWTGETVAFQNDSISSLEGKLLNDRMQTSYLDVSSAIQDNAFSFLTDTIQAFEIENGGEVSFIPSERFDAYVCIRSSGAPTFETEEASE